MPILIEKGVSNGQKKTPNIRYSNICRNCRLFDNNWDLRISYKIVVSEWQVCDDYERTEYLKETSLDD